MVIRKKLHDEELPYFYSSPNIVTMITARRMGMAEHVASMGQKRKYTGFSWRNHKDTNYLEDLSADDIIVLKWILKTHNERVLTALM